MNRSFKDLLSRLIRSEDYIEKYLPYNMFTQYCELLHCALDKEAIKKFRDYERAKIQIYLAVIIQDMAKKKDLLSVSNPPNVKNCDCAMGDFKNILFKATKITERNRQVLKEIKE